MITDRGCNPERSWIKASMSSNAGSCVEMRRSASGGVDVRDSKNPDGPVLSFSTAQFAAWLDDAGGDSRWISSATAPDEGGRIEMCRRPDGGVDVRDSARPDAVLYFTKAEFAAWLDGVSKREFHHLATG